MRRIGVLVVLAALASTAASRDASWLIEPVASFGAVTSGGWLYVYSGHKGETHSHSRDNLSTVFARLNLIDGHTWELLPGCEPLQGLPVVAHGGKVIRVGGLSAKNAAGAEEDLHSLRTVSAFDPIARSWTKLPGLPEGRSSHDAVTIGDTLYVVGGWGLSGASHDAVWHGTAWRLDLASAATASWTKIAEPPFKRRALAVAAAGGKLFAVGGMTPEEKPSTEVDIYDPSTDKWAKGPDFPAGAFGVSACGVGDAVLASASDGAVFRLADGKWSKVGSHAIPRIFHRLLPTATGDVLVVGGAARGGHLASIETFSMTPEGTPGITTWTLPYPGNAKNRQGVFLQDNCLWVFGGNKSLGQHDFQPENFLGEAFRIHLGSLDVTRLPDCPVRRESMQSGLLDGDGLAIGGFSTAEQGTRSWADAVRFDFKKKAWTELGVKLPEPRTQCAWVAHEGKVYLFGGLDYDSTRAKGDQFRHPVSVLAWDTKSRNASFEPIGLDLPHARRAFGAAVIGDLCYLVGGMENDFKLVKDAHVFDLKTKKLEEMPAPPRQRLSGALVALGGKLYLAGGSSPGKDGKLEANLALDVYDPETKTWSELVAELPISPRHVQMFAWRDRLLLYSANAETGSAIRMCVVDPARASR